MHSFAISILYTLLPLVLADTTYKISNIQFWQYNITSNYTKTSYTKEIVNLGAQGTTPGALVVGCGLSWNVSAAAQVPATGPPLVEQFNCTDPAVNITMQRMTVDPFQPWYLTIQLNNANPVTWNPFSHGPVPYRGGRPEESNGISFKSYLFDNSVFTVNGTPSASLPEALRQWKAPGGTATLPVDWSKDDGDAYGVRR